MKICKIEGCDGKHKAKGYCIKHYQQYLKYGEGLAPIKQTICSVDGCNNEVRAKGYCIKHYNQYRTYGKILERTRFDLNEIVIYEDYAEIVLYNKDNMEVARALIDLEDVDKVKDYKWYLNSEGYIYNRKIGLLHRFLMDCPSDLVVDHINHNPLDNRKSNLRICSQKQNLMNQSKPQRNTTSFYKGVSWNRCAKKWHAQIRINKKSKHIGLYDNELEASIAYDRAALLYFGVYAYINHDINNYIEYIVNELGLDPNEFDIDNSTDSK